MLEEVCNEEKHVTDILQQFKSAYNIIAVKIKGK